ncbi:MAG: hypothetical protein QXN68_01900 [Thermoplasmata archaeon]
MKKYVLYAAYGSNMLKERFLAYILGNNYEGRQYKGCTDKTEPQDYGYMYVPYKLYFAKKSSRWNDGGVAFLSCEKNDDANLYAIVRLWKILESQFKEIQEQEGKTWYHKVLHLGEKDGLEIKTFTGCWENQINSPSYEYLNIIKKGIKETTEWDDKMIEDYLKKFIKIPI